MTENPKAKLSRKPYNPDDREYDLYDELPFINVTLQYDMNKPDAMFLQRMDNSSKLINLHFTCQLKAFY